MLKKRTKLHLLPLFLTIFFGILISLLPHIIMSFQTGSYVWIADTDELSLYLQTAAQAYWNHPFYFTDPLFTDFHPTIYPWIQLFPGTIIAKLLHLGPLGISFLWRIFAGASIAIGWYALFWQFLKKRWLACCLSMLLLSESGLIQSKIGFTGISILRNILFNTHSTLFLDKPVLHSEWRIITPGLSLIFLQFFLWSMAYMQTNPKKIRYILAGTALGLLFYAYFYFWTAAILGLALGVLVDRKRKRDYLIVSGIGILIGLPSLIKDFILKIQNSSEWAQRSDLFISIPHFSEFIFPKIAPFLLLISTIWIWKKREDLKFFVISACAGLLLLNHQVITGLQIQNFHWGNFFGPVISFIVMIVLVDWYHQLKRRSIVIKYSLIFFLILHISLGLTLRYLEATQSKLSKELLSHYQLYVKQKNAPDWKPLEPNSVIAGYDSFVNFAGILDNQRLLAGYSADLSSNINNQDWNERIVLNEILSGVNRETFYAQQVILLDQNDWGIWARDAKKKLLLLDQRLKIYDRMLTSLNFNIDLYKVKYVAIKSNTPAPWYLNSGWELVQNSIYWRIWKRN